MKNVVLTQSKEFDSILEAGLELGKVTYIFGRHRGSFKTILTLNLSLALAACGVPVCIFTLEAPNEHLIKRMIKILGLCDENLSLAHSVCDYPLYLNDKFPVDIVEIENDIEHIVATKGCEIIFIDYLQLISWTGDIMLSRKEEVCAIAQILEKIAKRLNIAIVINVALSVTVSNRSRREFDFFPEPSEFIDSGLTNVISFFKSPVVVTHRPNWYKNHNIIDSLIEEPVEIIRYDPHLYVVKSIPLIFDKNTLKIKQI